MSPIPAKVTAIEKGGVLYQVVVEIVPKYRGSFNTLAFGEIKPGSGSLRDGGLDLVTIKTPALASQIRFRCGLFIDGRQAEEGMYGVCRPASMVEHRTGV